MEKRNKQMKMKNIPERIYLQIGEDTPKDCNFEELDEVTWCQDHVSDNDIEYVRKEKVIEIIKKECEFNELESIACEIERLINKYCK